MTALAQHSKETVEWGTPAEIADMGRYVLGGDYDLDPATSGYWNAHHIRAARFFDAVSDGLKQDWQVKPGMRINCNPTGGLVAAFWRRCVAAYLAGANVWWVGFSLEQIVYLQRDGFFDGAFRRVIPPRRISFLRGVAERPQRALFGDGPPPDEPVQVDDPTHGNYLVLMGHERAQLARFTEVCAAMPAEVF